MKIYFYTKHLEQVGKFIDAFEDVVHNINAPSRISFLPLAAVRVENNGEDKYRVEATINVMFLDLQDSASPDIYYKVQDTLRAEYDFKTVLEEG